MNTNILVAQIGAGFYKITDYKGQQDGDKVWKETPYTFEATLKEIIDKNGKSSDGAYRLLLLGTKGSAWENLCEQYPCEFTGDISAECELLKNSEENTEIFLKAKQSVGKHLTAGIKKRLKNMQAGLDIAVEIALIKPGKNEQELNENFNILYSAVSAVLDGKNSDRDVVDLYFDISNGFRSIPIYVYTLYNYFAEARKEKFNMHMYYGMFDAKESDNVAPLVNLQPVNDLMLLVNAVTEFKNCGSVVQILKVLENSSLKIPNSEALREAFMEFDFGTNANNLAPVEESILYLIELNKNAYSVNRVLRPESIILNLISNDFKVRFGGCFDGTVKFKYTYLTLQLAKWYMEQGRIINAASAVQEAVITYLMEKFTDKATSYINESIENSDRSNIEKPTPLEPESGVIRPGQLFNYNYRKIISSLFDSRIIYNEETENKEQLSNYIKNYKKLKKDIRNIGAHTSYRKKYKVGNQNKTPAEFKRFAAEAVNQQIEFLLDDFEKPKEASSLHWCFS